MAQVSKTRTTKAKAAPRKVASVKRDATKLATKAGKKAAMAATVPATIAKTAEYALKSAMDAGGEVLAGGMNLGKGAADVAVNAARDMAHGAADLVVDAAHVAGEAVEAGKAGLAKQIKGNPVTAAVTALGVGFIAGVAGRK